MSEDDKLDMAFRIWVWVFMGGGGLCCVYMAITLFWGMIIPAIAAAAFGYCLLDVMKTPKP